MTQISSTMERVFRRLLSKQLEPREMPYYATLQYCRHLGIQVKSTNCAYWVARIRTKRMGYRRHRIGKCLELTGDGLKAADALVAAEKWFSLPEVAQLAADPIDIGPKQQLDYCPWGNVYTVAHALADYVEWKRIAASRTTFEVNLSLINHHLLQSIGHIPASDFTGRDFMRLCTEVLETPPKRGNQQPRPRRPLASLDADALRRRKKTVNTLIGILRLSLRLAWEYGEIDSERAWRCLRRLPAVDRPRARFLTRLQCLQLMEACRPDLRRLVQAALYSGCRVGELISLQVRDVGTEGFGIFVAASKNYRSRFVYLPDEGMAFMLGLCRGRQSDERVFLTDDGRPWTGTYKHHFKLAVRTAGLPDDFVFHGLRHTYASQLVQVGVPLLVVAQQLGHSNTDTVSRTYGHLSSETREQVIRQRFSELDRAQTVTALEMAAELQSIRGSLQSDSSRDSEWLWPRSNFALSSSPLVSETRALTHKD